MKLCPHCSRSFPDKYKFCQHDRTVLIEATEEASTASPSREARTTIVETATPQTASVRSKALRRVAAGVGGIGLIIVIVAVYFIFFSFSAKKTILAEVEKTNLVKPQGASAYDLYLKYKNLGLTQSDVQEIGAVAVPQLEKRGDEIIRNVKNDQIESEDEWAEAIRVYSWLNELRPSSIYQARAQLSTGRLALLKKDYDGALASLHQSVERDGASALTLNTIGRVYLAKQDRASAQEYYRRATIAEPGWLLPWINLGAVSNDLKDYSSAETALRQAIQLNYQKASTHNLLGQALENTNRLCEARAEYQLALDSATNNPTPTVNVDSLRRKINALDSKGIECFD
jgi:tetratricopeptide (TPR) repeat protein